MSSEEGGHQPEAPVATDGCSSGSGNGPNHTSGPIKVLPPDPFDLDADGDGWGCENG